MDVRHHPAVYKLTRQNLVTAQGTNSGMKVILSPYGLAGTLTGQSYKDNDPVIQRLLNEWRQFYPIPVQEPAGKDYMGEDNQVPLVVEVIVGKTSYCTITYTVKRTPVASKIDRK